MKSAPAIALLLFALAAVCGPAIEIAIARAELFRYAPDSDGLFGVAVWLPGLYFAFGIVAALIGEIAAATTRTPAKKLATDIVQ